MAHYSPYTTPAQEYDARDSRYERYSSPTGGYIPTPSATPSPRGYYPSHAAASAGYPNPQVSTPQRPATRAHFRGMSTSGYEQGSFSPRQTISPRFTSGGQYATGENVSFTRKHLWSSTSSPNPARSRHERRSSFSYRTSTPHGESDEEEDLYDDVVRVIPAMSRTRRLSNVIYVSRGPNTDHYRSEQSAYPDDERIKTSYARHPAHTSAHPPPPHVNPHPAAAATAGHHPPRRYAETPAPDMMRRAAGHSRRASAAAHPIQRPQTVRPEAAHRREPAPSTSSRKPAEHASSARHPPKKSHEPRKPTEEDARRYGIPPGFSLKNWDPNEEPILLLGSVFDSNSLGKWIYDWTVFRDGPNSEAAELAGKMWLGLIQLAGKTKRAAKASPTIRRADQKEMTEDFVSAGERLTDKLRDLLSQCEQPMLEASRKGGKSKLGKGAGVEFINTLFGPDRQLAATEKFMKAVETWSFRFDANIEGLLREPTK